MTSCSCHAGTVNGRCAYCGARRRDRQTIAGSSNDRRRRPRAELGAAVDASSRGTTVERLNNAIVKLDWVAGGQSAGVKQAIRQLAEHWIRFYRAGTYWQLPDPVWFAKLGRYVEWYTRGYALLPADVRAAAPAPADIDPQFLELVNDTARRVVDANEEASAAASKLVKETAAGLFDFGLLWLALGGFAIWKIYASTPRAPATNEDG